MAKTISKRLVRAGIYRPAPNEEISIPQSRIDHWLEQAERMVQSGLRIPAPYKHDEKAVPVRTDLDHDASNSANNAGFWTGFRVEDGWLVGDLEPATPEDARKIGTKVKGCSIYAIPKWSEGGTDWEDAITHIALTNKPVVQSEEFPALALSADSFVAALGSTDEYTSEDQQSSVSLDCALDILAKLGLELPADTTAQNLLERLVTAGTAVLSHKATQEGQGLDVTKQPPGSKEPKATPIAMSLELSFAAKLLAESGATNPETNKPWDVESLQAAAKVVETEEVALSAEQQASLNFGLAAARRQYQTGFEDVVNQGRVPQKVVLDKVVPLLKTAKIIFSADGNTVSSPELDPILAAFQALPANSVLTGMNPTSVATMKRELTRVGTAFSLDLVGPRTPKIEDPPADEDVNQPLSDEQIKSIVDQQMAMAGRS